MLILFNIVLLGELHLRVVGRFHIEGRRRLQLIFAAIDFQPIFAVAGIHVDVRIRDLDIFLTHAEKSPDADDDGADLAIFIDDEIINLADLILAFVVYVLIINVRDEMGFLIGIHLL